MARGKVKPGQCFILKFDFSTTTTVPADCLRTPFNSGGYIGDGNLIVPSTSCPNFP
jgi:hypothetical protein